MRNILKLLFALIMPICLSVAHDIIEQEPSRVALTNIRDINGEEFNFENLEDNVLVLHFWATWCSGCIQEMETLNKLQKILKKERVIILPISEDFKGEGVVREFYKIYNLKNLPAFIDKKQKLFNDLGVVSLPATFILDSSGQVVAHAKGPVNWLEESNTALLKKYIKQENADNKEYIKLLDKQKVFEKPQDQVQNKHINELVPKEAETLLEVANENDIQEGSIKLKNSKGDEASLKIRRPLNNLNTEKK